MLCDMVLTAFLACLEKFSGQLITWCIDIAHYFPEETKHTEKSLYRALIVYIFACIFDD